MQKQIEWPIKIFKPEAHALVFRVTKVNLVRSKLDAKLSGGKLIRLSRFLIGIGFFWMLFWTVIGGLLGAKINATIIASETSWLESLNRTLLRSAHAHMNTMGMSLILMGLCANNALKICSLKTTQWLAGVSLVGVFLFGLGLICEAYVSVIDGNIWPSLVTILGGFLYMLGLAGWGTVFFTASRRRKVV